MNEQVGKSKFNLLNNGLFNFYRRTMHSFVDDENEKNENKKKTSLGIISEINVGAKTNKQICAKHSQQTPYNYKRDIESMKLSPEEKMLDISKNKKEHKKEEHKKGEHKKEEHKKEEHKTLEKNFSNDLMQSYYNSTHYNYSDLYTNYLKEPKEMKYGEYIQNNEYMQHDENLNTYTNNNYNYNYNYNNTYNTAYNNPYNSPYSVDYGKEYGNEYKKLNKNSKLYNTYNENYNDIYKNNDLLLCNEITGNTTNAYNFNKMKEDASVYNEIKKLKEDITLLQLMNANLQKQFITNNYSNAATVPPHNIIINNKTEVASSTVNTIEKKEEKKQKGIIYFLLKKLLSSRFNQMLFISSIFVSFFLLNKQWQRAVKVAKLEKRVNSNILLKSVKMLEETMGIRKLNYI